MSKEIRSLAAATMLQAVRDYFEYEFNPEMQKMVLKDLRSSWMDLLTGGMSLTVADQLEKNSNEIRQRIIRNVTQFEIML
jgi:hypothetical protein